MPSERCFLARFSTRACEGRLVRAHLVRAQTIAREAGQEFVWDPRTWVWSCGGHGHGNEGHHGMLDTHRIRLLRSDLPDAVEEFCAEHGLLWWLERTYGEHEE